MEEENSGPVQEIEEEENIEPVEIPTYWGMTRVYSFDDPEQPYFPPNFTILENVIFHVRLTSISLLTLSSSLLM